MELKFLVRKLSELHKIILLQNWTKNIKNKKATLKTEAHIDLKSSAQISIKSAAVKYSEQRNAA